MPNSKLLRVLLALWLSLLLSPFVRARTTSQTEGFNSPSTTVDDATIGTVAWSNPNNSQSSDDTWASASLDDQTAHYIKATGFSFTLTKCQSIDGIQVDVEARISSDIPSSTTALIDPSNTRLVIGGSFVGTAMADGTTLTITDQTISFGGPSNLWGTTPSCADVTASNFGVGVSCNNISPLAAGEICLIDHISIQVTYTRFDSNLGILHVGG